MQVKKAGVMAAGVAALVITLGTGIAVAQPDDSNETPITGDALTQASAAALTFTGGGTITQTKVGDEESYYQVEVTLADGRQTDVQLDQQFHVVGSKTEPAGVDDNAPDGPDGGN
ncbi:MAG: hypothetical protein JWR37_2209 [Mycobacterium sp.]|nr:hypothetical protein [Mycobacterium sp.]